MPASSSPSLPARNPTNPQMRLGTCARASSQSKKQLRTPPRVTFYKARVTLLKKASALCEHTHARAAVIVFSSTGKLCPSDHHSVEEMAEIIYDYVLRNGGEMPPMGPKEGVDRVKKEGKCFSNRFTTISKKASKLCTKTDARVAVIVYSKTGSLYALGFPTVGDVISDWLEKQRESCVKKDVDSLNLKCELVLHYVAREKLKDISGSGNFGVGAGCDSEVLNDDDIDSVLQSFKASHPELFPGYFPDLKDHVRDDFSTSAVNSAVASGSTRKEPMRPVLLGCEFNTHSSLNLSENNPSVNAGAGGHSGVGVGHSYVVLNDDEANLIRSLLAGNGNFDRNGGSTSLVHLDDFSSGLDENDCLIPPENSTVHG